MQCTLNSDQDKCKVDYHQYENIYKALRSQ